MKHTFTSCCAALLLAAGCSVTNDTITTTKPDTEGAKPGVWTQDFDAAKKAAVEKGLPLFINFTGSDWCGWCILMDDQVFSKPAWEEYAQENLMLVYINFPQDKSLVPEKYVARNEELAKSFGVQGFPTYIILDSDAETALGQLGASRNATPESFIAQVKAITGKRARKAE